MNIQENNYDLDLNIDFIEECISVYIDANFKLEKDEYGMDLDGNRSMGTITLELEDIKIIDESNGYDITQMVENYYNEEYERIISMLEEKAYEKYEE